MSRPERAYRAWAPKVPAQYHVAGRAQFEQVLYSEHLNVVTDVALKLAGKAPSGTWNHRGQIGPLQALSLTVAMANADVVPYAPRADSTDDIVATIARHLIAITDTEQRAALAGVHYLGSLHTLGLRPWVGVALADHEAKVPRETLDDVARACQYGEPRVEWVAVPHLGWATYHLGAPGGRWRGPVDELADTPDGVLFPGCTVHVRREPEPDGDKQRLTVVVDTEDGCDPGLLNDNREPRLTVKVNDTVVFEQ